jgi:hypothetical protein
MAKSSDLPEALRPYTFHGVDLAYKPGEKEALGDCPFCSREGKFSVDVETGVYRCFVCMTGTDNGGGNATVFIRKLFEVSDAATTPADYAYLANHRRLMKPDTVMQWACCRSITTGDFLVPGYSIDGKLQNLYRYIEGAERSTLYPTPTLNHHLHGVNLFDKHRDIIYLCEGPWDAMALWEVLEQTKSDDEGNLSPTANVGASLLSLANVLAVPGCSTFLKSWLPLFQGKTVCIMYDSDYPRKNAQTGKPLQPAGHYGMMRVVQMLKESPTPPASIHGLVWGKDGYDPVLPDGTDLRDILSGKVAFSA